MRNTCTSRVGIPCRFAARDPSTLGAGISHTSLASIKYYYNASPVYMALAVATQSFDPFSERGERNRRPELSIYASIDQNLIF